MITVILVVSLLERSEAQYFAGNTSSLGIWPHSFRGASTTSGRVQLHRGVWPAPFLPGCSVQHSFYVGLSRCLTQAWSCPWMRQFDDPLGLIYVRYRTTNTGTLPSARTSDV